jgi:hypothetical protein
MARRGNEQLCGAAQREGNVLHCGGKASQRGVTQEQSAVAKRDVEHSKSVAERSRLALRISAAKPAVNRSVT